MKVGLRVKPLSVSRFTDYNEQIHVNKFWDRLFKFIVLLYCRRSQIILFNEVLFIVVHSEARVNC